MASTATLELKATGLAGVSLNGMSDLSTADSVDWHSTLQGSLGRSLLGPLRIQLTAGTHLIIASHTNVLGDTAADTVTVYVDTNPPSGSGQITGTVRFQGAPLVGIAVALSGMAADNTTTDGQGGYSFSGLAAGDYTVLITPPPGVEIVRAKNVTLADGQSATVDFGS